MKLGRPLLLIVALIVVAVAAARPPATGIAQPGDQRVRVLSTAGSGEKPCGAVELTGARFIRGGCRTRLQDLDIEVSIHTVFGKMFFGDCMMDMNVTFDRQGRLWLDRLQIGGGSPCSDVVPCAPAEVIAKRKPDTPFDSASAPPWRGQVDAVTSEGATGSFRLCVDTCVGRYEGKMRFELTRSEQGWGMRATSGSVGRGNLQFDADWVPVKPTDFEFAPA